MPAGLSGSTRGEQTTQLSSTLLLLSTLGFSPEKKGLKSGCGRGVPQASASETQPWQIYAIDSNDNDALQLWPITARIPALLRLRANVHSHAWWGVAGGADVAL